jgi:hypothetical protein
MKRSRTGLSTLVWFGLLVGSLAAQTAKAPSVKEIMTKVNKPGGSYFTIAKELKQDDPRWDELNSQAKEMTQLVSQLSQNAPPKGEKPSWEKLTRAYADKAAALEQAIAKKDQKAAVAAANLLGVPASCKSCHAAHRK